MIARLLQSCLATFVALFVTLGVTGCATATAEIDRDEGYDFAAAQSYAWVTEEPILITFGDPQPNVRTEANEQRVRAAIDRELQARGFTKVPITEAQLVVAFSVGVRKAFRLEGGDRTSTITDGPSDKQTKGTLNIYLVDPESNKEVWHGAVSKWLKKTDDPDAIVNEAVGKIMAQYP